MFEKIDSLGVYLCSLRNRTFTLLLISIIYLKTGVGPIGSEFVGWLRTTAKALPQAKMYLVSSPLPLLMMRAMNYPGDLTWWLVNAGIYAFWAFLTLRLLLKHFPKNPKIAILCFVASTPFASAAGLIGHIDIFPLLGASIAALGTFKFAPLVGCLIAVGGNADQAIATSVCLLFLILAGSKFSREISKWWIPTSALVYGSIHVLLRISSENNPIKVIFGQIYSVFLHSLGSWNLILFSTLGLLWVPWILFVLPSFKGMLKKLYAIISVIVLPTLMSLLILDGTKVGTTVGFLPLLITTLESLRDKDFAEHLKSRILGFAFLFLVIFPAIIVDNGGLLRLPIRKILLQFGLIQ